MYTPGISVCSCLIYNLTFKLKFKIRINRIQYMHFRLYYLCKFDFVLCISVLMNFRSII